MKKGLKIAIIVLVVIGIIISSVVELYALIFSIGAIFAFFGTKK